MSQMNFFTYHDTDLMVESIPLQKIAEEFGTPCYVYSQASIERSWYALSSSLKSHEHRICYAVKANGNLSVLKFLAKLGAGFDIVSGGELERVLLARGEPTKIIFSGVGKQDWEIKRALEVGIFCFNVESEEELFLIQRIAQELRLKARIAIRINPDVDAKTHPYIATGLKENKFGLMPNQALNICKEAMEMPNIYLSGIACHIGSQLSELSPFVESLGKLLAFAEQLREMGICINHIDIGGGLGVNYGDQRVPGPFEYAEALLQRLNNEPYELLLEPGRAIVGNAGVLLTKVLFLKHAEERHFAIVDAAMNDLLRPALYGAWHAVEPVRLRMEGPAINYDLVGPVCETADFIAKDREMRLRPGDVLAIRTAGAYGFAMSSQYNSRPRPPEVWVNGDNATLIRRRETFMDLVAHELNLSTR